MFDRKRWAATVLLMCLVLNGSPVCLKSIPDVPELI